MALKLKYKKSIFVTLLYIAYVLNFSVLTVWQFNFHFSQLRNGLLILLLLVSLKYLNFKFNYTVLFFVIICFLSIIFNNIHPAFNAKLRFIFFLMTITGIGLLFKFKDSSEYYIDINQIFKINTYIVIFSFFAYFTAIGSMGRGNFNGILNHSNALGPIAALVCVEKVLDYYKGQKSYKSLIIAAIAFFVLILSGARSPLGALLICLTIIGIYIYKVKFIIWGSVILVLGSIAFITLKNYNDLLIPEEHLANRYRSRTIFEKGFDNTRLAIWEERVDEFVENPLLGSGFSAVNTEVIPEESVSYDIETGSIQPGSGYLGILSMLGIFGYIGFVLIMISALKKLYINRNSYANKEFLIIVSILMFVLFHSIFEGYLISSGSILFFIFWLSISYIFNKNEA